MKLGHIFSGGVLLALGVACGVEVGIDGKACPCSASEGYVCDTIKNICVHPDQVTTIVVVDGGVVTQPACDPCPCTKDEECKDATRPVCGPDKVCVQCTPANDKCTIGTYCNAKNQCTPGCQNDDACSKLSQTSPFCQTDRHQCVTCKNSTQCPTNQACTPSGTCATACSNKTQCTGGGTQDCCGGLCIDVGSDVLNCGGCNKPCSAVDNGTPSCKGGSCAADCADGFGTCGGGPTCTTNFRIDKDNCGKCDNHCSALPHVVGPSCAAGKCQFSGCEDGWMNADGNNANGCEAQCGNAPGAVCCPGEKCFNGGNCNHGTQTCKGGSGSG